ncbi:MAG TPA: sigma-70 family RNA polymerase sigma factor [Mucilaginibacter sp.]|jgi:RNA polymerase sigma-70 factor (ECF subfamily)
MLKTSLSDSELLHKVFNNDYRAFTELYERYWLAVFKTANKYITDKEACEDIVHDIFLTIWNRRGQLNIQDFNFYIKASARYQVYAFLKKVKKAAVSYLEDCPEPLLSHDNAGYSKVIYMELEKEINDCLKLLPKRSSEIFVLSRINHLTNDEISIKLGISKRSVENQLTVALKHLRLHFRDSALITLILYCLLFT